jgi:hypothetical protein
MNTDEIAEEIFKIVKETGESPSNILSEIKDKVRKKVNRWQGSFYPEDL